MIVKLYNFPGRSSPDVFSALHSPFFLYRAFAASSLLSGAVSALRNAYF